MRIQCANVILMVRCRRLHLLSNANTTGDEMKSLQTNSELQHSLTLDTYRSRSITVKQQMSQDKLCVGLIYIVYVTLIQTQIYVGSAIFVKTLNA